MLALIVIHHGADSTVCLVHRPGCLLPVRAVQLELPIRGRRKTFDSQGLQCPQPQHTVETNFGSAAQSYIPVFLTGARKDHVSEIAQELRLLAEAQQPHDFLRIYLLASPSRCTELAAWFEETLWARHGMWETDEGLYERNVRAFRRTLHQWRNDPFNGREAGMAWIKAFSEGLPAPFIEPRASNETLVNLLAKLAFGEQSRLSDASAQPGDASLAVKHASNPLLEGIDSLQHIFGTLNNQAMAAGIG